MDRFKSRVHLRARPLARRLSIESQARQGRLRRTGCDELSDRSGMAFEYSQGDIAQVAQQAEPVGDLDGMRRSLPHRLGVLAAAVAADDRDAGMLGEPASRSIGRSIR